MGSWLPVVDNVTFLGSILRRGCFKRAIVGVVITVVRGVNGTTVPVPGGRKLGNCFGRGAGFLGRLEGGSRWTRRLCLFWGLVFLFV